MAFKLKGSAFYGHGNQSPLEKSALKDKKYKKVEVPHDHPNKSNDLHVPTQNMLGTTKNP